MKSEKEIKKRLENKRNEYYKHKDNSFIKSYMDGYITALEWVLSNERMEE